MSLTEEPRIDVGASPQMTGGMLDVQVRTSKATRPKDHMSVEGLPSMRSDRCLRARAISGGFLVPVFDGKVAAPMGDA